jgi:hypothetical protein
MTEEWAAVMRMYDQSILLLFGGVVSFALNWYVFEHSAAIQRVLTWVALLSSIVVLILEVIK